MVNSRLENALCGAVLLGAEKVDEVDLSNIVDNMNSITYSHARENLAHTSISAP